VRSLSRHQSRDVRPRRVLAPGLAHWTTGAIAQWFLPGDFSQPTHAGTVAILSRVCFRCRKGQK